MATLIQCDVLWDHKNKTHAARLIMWLAWNDKIKIARLPLRYFANGHTFFVQRMYAKATHPPPFVVHMTYQYGDSSAFPYGKRQRMREARVWQVDPPSYFRDGMYLAVAPEAATLPIDYLPVLAPPYLLLRTSLSMPPSPYLLVRHLTHRLRLRSRALAGQHHDRGGRRGGSRHVRGLR